MKKCYLILAVLTIMVLAVSCGPTAPSLDYQVLREWDIPAGGIGMDILVSETATKEEALALANYLRSKYSYKGYIFISIYDSKEAQASNFQGTMSDEEFRKHFLVQITRNPKTGYDEIEWLATERGY